MNQFKSEYKQIGFILSVILLIATIVFISSITLNIFIILLGALGSAYYAYQEGLAKCLEHDTLPPKEIINLFWACTFASIFIMIPIISDYSNKQVLLAVAIFCFGCPYIIIYGYAWHKSLEHSFKNPDNNKIYIGHSVNERFPRPLFIPESVRNQHQIIFGTTGSAKTVGALYPQIEHDIRVGKIIFIIDPKGDFKFREKVFHYCQKYQREFQYFSITNSHISDPYNPFLFGNSTQIKDKLMSVTDWSDKGDGVFYKKISELALMKGTMQVKEKITIDKLLKVIPDSDELIGLKADLELLNLNEFSNLLNNDEHGIKEIYDNNKVFFISLDEDSYPVIAKSLGKIILSDLKSLSGYINNKIPEAKRKPISLYVDEVSTFMSEFMAEYFFNFLAKTRSSNMSVIMASHSPKGDFEKYGEHVLDRLISLCTTRIIMRNSAPGSAEYLAKMLGTQESEKITSQINGIGIVTETGLGTRRPVNEFIVSPNVIKRLQRAEVIVHILEGNIMQPVYLDHYHHDELSDCSYEAWREKNKR